MVVVPVVVVTVAMMIVMERGDEGGGGEEKSGKDEKQIEFHTDVFEKKGSEGAYVDGRVAGGWWCTKEREHRDLPLNTH